MLKGRIIEIVEEKTDKKSKVPRRNTYDNISVSTTNRYGQNLNIIGDKDIYIGGKNKKFSAQIAHDFKQYLPLFEQTE